VADVHDGNAIFKRVYPCKYAQGGGIFSMITGIASRVYNICNNNGHHLVPYIMGGTMPPDSLM